MNITLRKANAVQTAINDAMKSIEVKLSVELNEFQDAESVLKQQNDKVFANDARRQKLLMALYNIRALVGTANANCGINLVLAKSAFVDKRIAQLSEIADAQEVISLDVLKGKLDKIKNRPADSRVSIYGRDDTVATSIVSRVQIDAAKAEILNLKKQKQKLNDEILELNIKTEIPLTEEVVATLQAEGLL